jgi:hypothetical protein
LKRINILWLCLHEVPRVQKFIRPENIIEITGGGAGGGVCYCFMGIVSFYDDEKNYTLKNG